jgi:large subunit ribosomal protein L32e
MKDIISEFTAIKGLGEAKAKALVKAGYKSTEDLASASVKDLSAVEGIGPSLAEKIKAGASELATSVSEEPASTELAATTELEMDEESRRLFKVRKVQKGKKPDFKRADSHKFKRLDSNWRRPRGLQGKKRRHVAAKGALAQVGYGSPVTVKGLHPSGFAEILVRTPSDVDKVDASIEAIRIARTVGAKKRNVIEEMAMELNIKVLNPTRGE